MEQPFDREFRACSVEGCTYAERLGDREGDFIEGKFVCPTHATIAAAEYLRNAAYRPGLPNMVINRRELRTRQLLAHMLQVLRPFLIQERDAARVLNDFLYAQGAEIITEADRIKAGLAPRDHNGLTLQELQIIEARLLIAQMAPPSLVVSAPELKTMIDIRVASEGILKDAALFLELGARYAPDDAVRDQNRATQETLKTRGLATVMKELAHSIRNHRG